MDIYISGISYKLGEQKYQFRDIDRFDDLIKKYGLVNKPEYWCWGNYYKSGKTLFEQAEFSISKTLDEISISGKDIELIFFCCSLPGIDFKKINSNLGTVLINNNLTQVQIIGQSIGGCTSIFHVIRIAEALLKQGLYKNILVFTTDLVPKDFDRMYQFGIYSDSASSFLISSEEKKGYKLKNIYAATDTKLMSGVMENRDSHFIHLNKVHEKTIDFEGFDKEKIVKVFMTNLFKPIMNINLVRLGYKPDQHFYDNIEEIGHCFASDPLINLKTYEENHQEEKGVTYMLASMASGHAAFAIIEKET